MRGRGSIKFAIVSYRRVFLVMHLFFGNSEELLTSGVSTLHKTSLAEPFIKTEIC